MRLDERRGTLMRLKTYINEESTLNIQDIVDNIKKKCAPYFKKAGPTGDFLYRGVRSSSLSDKRLVHKVKPRTDRRPLDTDKSLHALLDELFLKHKGWKARSEGVFLTSNRSTARAYGKVFVMFPIGSFKFLYNPDIVDLTNYLNASNIHSASDAQNVFNDHPNAVEDMLKVIKGYTNKNLSAGTNKDVEVMIKCKEYFLVDPVPVNGAILLKEIEKLF